MSDPAPWRLTAARVTRLVGVVALLAGIALFALLAWGPDLTRRTEGLALSGLISCVGAWLGIGKGLSMLLTGRVRVATLLGRAEGGGVEVYAMGATFGLVGLGVMGLGLMLMGSHLFGY